MYAIHSYIVYLYQKVNIIYFGMLGNFGVFLSHNDHGWSANIVYSEAALDGLSFSFFLVGCAGENVLILHATLIINFVISLSDISCTNGVWVSGSSYFLLSLDTFGYIVLVFWTVDNGRLCYFC